MSLNGCFNSLWLNSNVALSDGGGTVLEKPLDKGDVVAVGLVDFRSIPLAEAVRSDSLRAKIIADKGKLLLHGSLCDGEDQIPCANAVAKAVVFNVLFHHKRNGEHSALARFLLNDAKRAKYRRTSRRCPLG